MNNAERQALTTATRASLLSSIRIKNAMGDNYQAARFEQKIDRALRYLNNGNVASAALEASDVAAKLAEVDTAVCGDDEPKHERY